MEELAEKIGRLAGYREPSIRAGIDTQTKGEAEKGCRQYEKVACPLFKFRMICGTGMNAGCRTLPFPSGQNAKIQDLTPLPFFPYSCMDDF